MTVHKIVNWIQEKRVRGGSVDWLDRDQAPTYPLSPKEERGGLCTHAMFHLMIVAGVWPTRLRG